MKKTAFKLFAIVALFAGMVMTSCNKEEGEGEGTGSGTVKYTDFESAPKELSMGDQLNINIFTNEDFAIQNYGEEESFFAAFNPGEGAVATQGDWRGLVTPLAEKTEIGSSSNFMMWQDQATFFQFDNFKNGETAYIGFCITKDGQLHYGWVKMKVQSGKFIVYGYAYEQTPGQSIKAGQTK